LANNTLFKEGDLGVNLCLGDPQSLYLPQIFFTKTQLIHFLFLSRKKIKNVYNKMINYLSANSFFKFSRMAKDGKKNFSAQSEAFDSPKKLR
jgi:hypothetical protein